MEVKPAPIRMGRSNEEILSAEGQSILKEVRPRDFLIALDRSGSLYDSLELAEWVEKLIISAPILSFIIGGPLGLPDSVLKKAGKILSLSKLTLTHEMSRLLLLEQLYRAFSINKGERYHK
jgi:23S rRNA (pseudouridine1915-N3)-methyltransferase